MCSDLGTVGVMDKNSLDSTLFFRLLRVYFSRSFMLGCEADTLGEDIDGSFDIF